MLAAPKIHRLHAELLPAASILSGSIGTMWRILDNRLRHIGATRASHELIPLR